MKQILLLNLWHILHDDDDDDDDDDESNVITLWI
jgi:hypothetical protein